MENCYDALLLAIEKSKDWTPRSFIIRLINGLFNKNKLSKFDLPKQNLHEMTSWRLATVVAHIVLLHRFITIDFNPVI